MGPAGAAIELPWGLFVTAPVLGRANMGIGEGYVSEPVTVPVELVRGRNFRVWEVAGSCMEPALSEGDIVLIDVDQRPQDGEIVVARRAEGEVLLKRYYRRTPTEDGGPVRIELRPDIEAAGVGELVIAAEGEVEVLGVVFLKMRVMGRRRVDRPSWAPVEPPTPHE